jgi:hypothetical protein
LYAAWIAETYSAAFPRSGVRIREMNVLWMCRVSTTSSMESTMFSPQMAIRTESPRRVITAFEVKVLVGSTSHPFSSLSS